MIEWGHHQWLQSLEVLSKRYNKFVAEVYKEAEELHPSNFVICPLMVHTMLAFACYCGNEETAKEISDVLCLPVTKKHKFEDVFKERIRPILKNNLHYVYNASAIFLNEDILVDDAYDKLANNFFGTKIHNVYFRNKTKSSIIMNTWLRTNTYKRVRNMIHEYDIALSTTAMFINAIGFYGKWTLNFNKNTNRVFHQSETRKRKADMLHTIDYFNYSENASLKATFLEMPFAENDITMTFVLPNAINGLAELEKNIETILAQTHVFQKVHVTIPIFEIETTLEYKPILMEMGIVKAFQTNADFSNLTITDKKIWIHAVTQRSQIRIDEAGVIIPLSDEYDYGIDSLFMDSKVFLADHPFMYIVKSQSCGVIFIGKCCIPQAKIERYCY